MMSADTGSSLPAVLKADGGRSKERPPFLLFFATSDTRSVDSVTVGFAQTMARACCTKDTVLGTSTSGKWRSTSAKGAVRAVGGEVLEQLRVSHNGDAILPVHPRRSHGGDREFSGRR